MVGLNPVMHIIAHHIGIEQIIVAHCKEEANGLLLSIRNDLIMEVPGSTWSFWVKGPLLVHKCSGGGEHPVVEIGSIPRHNKSG